LHEYATTISWRHFDAFLVKYDAAGNHLFSKRFGDGYPQHLVWVAADAAGDVLALAQNQHTIDFGGGPITTVMRPSGGRVFGAFDPRGRHIWSHAVPEGVGPRGFDATGAIVFTGASSNAIDLGTGPIVSATSRETGDSFVARVGLDGRPLASERWSVPGNFSTFGPHGELVLSGKLAAPVDVGCGAIQPGPDADTFVAVLAPR
jgi:hypothetical protein